jgi:hypothetical protein
MEARTTGRQNSAEGEQNNIYILKTVCARGLELRFGKRIETKPRNLSRFHKQRRGSAYICDSEYHYWITQLILMSALGVPPQYTIPDIKRWKANKGEN